MIPVRNAEATLGVQLEALRTQEFEGPWEIIVVDDRSTDRSKEIAQEWKQKLPNLRIASAHGRGAGNARNTGAQLAVSDRLLFCDADDVASVLWVGALTAALDRFDLVGGALEYERLNTRHSLASRNQIQLDGLTSALGHLQYASSANLGIRRGAFEAVGGFDQSLEGPAEDADLGWRVQHAGFAIGFAPDAVVHYRLRETRADLMRQMYAYALANQQLYAKHHGLGNIAVSPFSRYKVAGFELLRALIQFPLVLSTTRRWRYLSRLARCRGSIVGLVRYRIRPW